MEKKGWEEKRREGKRKGDNGRKKEGSKEKKREGIIKGDKG